ncbi:molybdopterin molybdenumtransferase MoeA [Rhizobiales bacterium RZME27]|uniref:Molybdopterin molybdenumtransferase n=1 Tax=Endobacterium cereale TaxID=2663029 RepID=A0A6A8A5R1_9HYPH|nr:gephyrin-like molybdotransferase Glp [Endobacterium cereale]MEB2843490.1 gephyrin-like molybdotransferase Glp [Endobacterium cereale]MQY44606.1 molybdopterin molybdenumtransferase MoeA [Endobacterium cereale]
MNKPSLLPVEDAKARLAALTRPVTQIEMVPLIEAAGRVLGRPVAAHLTQPPFNASAMDGYAIRATDTPEIGSELTVIGTASAGHAFDGEIGPGEAVRIFTGAPVPEGADTILIQEDAEKLDGNRIRTTFAVTPGRHIRPRGQDFAQGEAVLSAGMQLDFSTLTLAAATNNAKLPVYRKPVIAILATGDELVQPGSVLGPAQIVASNTFGVAALARDNGAEVLDLGIVPDDKAQIEKAISMARLAGADVLVTIGGASVGDHDLVQGVLKSVGMELDFWRIAMRPGKPLMVGSLGDMQVLGLPGNPVASLVCSLLFLEPTLRKLAHLPERKREAEALTSRTLAGNDLRQDFLRAKLSRNDDGKLVADAYGKQDSSMMKILAQSDCLVIRPPHAPELPEGSPCPVILLRP